MAEIDKKILTTFKDLLPKLSPTNKEKLLMFGEGMAFVVSQYKEKTA